MAKRKQSLIKIIGTINGVSHYVSNGKPQSRKSSPPSKDQIYNDPRFASVRANNKEFGGGSRLSKAICTGLQANVKTFKDSRFTSRLTGICRKIIQKGSGIPGQREANLFNHPHALIGFQLQKTQIFNQIYTAKPTVATNNNRSIITVNIGKSSQTNLNKYPKSVTHFQLTAAITTVSAHTWHTEAQKYQPEHPESNALGTSVQTMPLLCKMEHQNIILQINTPITPINANVAITVWLGINFGSEENNQFTPLQTPKAMECIAIT